MSTDSDSPAVAARVIMMLMHERISNATSKPEYVGILLWKLERWKK